MGEILDDIGEYLNVFGDKFKAQTFANLHITDDELWDYLQNDRNGQFMFHIPSELSHTHYHPEPYKPGEEKFIKALNETFTRFEVFWVWMSKMK